MIKIKQKYSFFKNPIKFIKGFKNRKLLEEIVNYKWDTGMKEDFEKAMIDMICYGQATLKDGKTISFKDFNK